MRPRQLTAGGQDRARHEETDTEQQGRVLPRMQALAPRAAAHAHTRHGLCPLRPTQLGQRVSRKPGFNCFSDLQRGLTIY